MQKFKLHSASKRRNQRKFGVSFIKVVQNLIALAVLIGIGLFIIPAETPENFSKVAYKIEKYLDFKVANVEVVGNEKIPTEEILKLANVKYGESLINIDLEKISEAIHKNNWVSSLVVSRSFPNKVRILVEEEKPAAIFIEKEKFYLINISGKKIEQIDSKNIDSGYIILRGEGANKNFSKILSEVYKHHLINKSMVEMHRIADRRWDIFLQDKTKIMLPELNFEEGIKFANDFLEESEIKFSTVIDLRLLPDKIYLREVK